MYFSPVWDISLTYQCVMTQRSERSEFIWNFTALSNLNDIWPLPVRTKVIAGYVGEAGPFTLISRKSRFNAGVHVWNRGADAAGNPANFVETEEIWRGEGRCVSFVQLRGSIPTFWTQYPTGEVTRPVSFGSEAENGRRCGLHFEALRRRYGVGIVLLALTDLQGKEGRLTVDFQRFAREKGVEFRYLPFHEICMTPGEIESRLADLEGHMEYCETEGEKVVATQTQFLRTSCMSSLDRTGAVQGIIASIVFRHFAFIPRAEHTRLWEENADQLAQSYACTRGQNRAIVGTGHQTEMGEVQDSLNRIERFWKSLFVEGEVDDAYAAITQSRAIGPRQERKNWIALIWAILVLAIHVLLALVRGGRKAANASWVAGMRPLIVHPHGRDLRHAEEWRGDEAASGSVP
jgi:hypothetical protein